MNCPFSWNDGKRQDARPHLFVGGGDAELAGLGQRDLLLDQLLHDALVDAELAEQPLVHVGAVRRAVRLHLAG